MRKSVFEKIISENFWELESRFGFKRESRFSPDGVTTIFQNATSEVVINYELGQRPWITIADITNPENARVSLDWLLVELGEKKTPAVYEAFSPARLDESQLGLELQTQSAQLIEFGAELLNGNFSILPALKKRADAYLLDCEKFARQHQVKP